MLCSTVHDPTRERLTDPLVASVPGRVPEVGAATIGRLVEAADVLWEETCDSFSFAARDRRAGNGSSFKSCTCSGCRRSSSRTFVCAHQTAHSMLGGVWLGTHSGSGYAHGRHYRGDCERVGV